MIINRDTQEVPTTEEAPKEALSPYGDHKLSAESVLMDHDI